MKYHWNNNQNAFAEDLWRTVKEESMTILCIRCKRARELNMNNNQLRDETKGLEDEALTYIQSTGRVWTPNDRSPCIQQDREMTQIMAKEQFSGGFPNIAADGPVQCLHTLYRIEYRHSPHGSPVLWYRG